MTFIVGVFMPSNPYPTLSEVGNVYDPVQKVEWIFADYIASKHSQSILFFGQVSSLIFDEYRGQYDGFLTSQEIEQSLNKLYSAYFDSVEISVFDDSKDNSQETHVRIQGTLTDKGKNYQLNEVLHFNNGRIKRLAKFN